MTEQEWLGCNDPHPMLELLTGVPMSRPVCERKLRLFAVACSRQMWDWIDIPGRAAVEAAEKFADGTVGSEEMRAARLACQGAGGQSAWYAAATIPAVAARNAARSAQAGVASNALIGSEAAELAAQAVLLRDIFGNPFRPYTLNPLNPAWLTPKVVDLAQAIYDNRAFDRLPSLAVALEEAGCTNADLLDHCRGPGPHVRGCRGVDTVLGKEAMTQREWLESDQAYLLLLHARSFSSIRKLRLVAASFARWLKTLPGYEEARPCADIIEEIADNPKPFIELEPRLYALPGWSWALSHTLAPDEQVGPSLSKMVFMAECSFNERSESPKIVHQVMIGLLHEMFGNPFLSITLHPSWLTPKVVDLAQEIYDDRAFDLLPALADALEEVGCDNPDILAHCRGPRSHVRGCWAVDMVLGRGEE